MIARYQGVCLTGSKYGLGKSTSTLTDVARLLLTECVCMYIEQKQERLRLYKSKLANQTLPETLEAGGVPKRVNNNT
jgi:hypothetical protein